MESLEDTFSDLALFSLANSSSEISNDTLKTNYYFLIYAGIALLVIIFCILIYKNYVKNKKVSFSEDQNEFIYENEVQ